MKKTAAVVSLLLAGTLNALCFALDKNAIVEHIRESYSFPPGIDVVLGDPKPSEVPGFDVLDLKISRGDRQQTDKLYISKNGRYYVLGGFKDLQYSPDKERAKKIDISKSPVRGSKTAPVTVVEYTDFQCPYCEIGYQVMRKKIMREFPTQIRWVYKSLPLKSIHPWAEPAAIGAECAHLQGEDKFWAMHDALFSSQRLINLRNVHSVLDGFSKGENLESVLPDFKQMLDDPAKKAEAGQMAKDYGEAQSTLKQMDAKKFKICYEGKESSKAVDRDVAEAEHLSIPGTPAFVIEGRLIPSADYDSLKQTIQESLKRHEKNS